MVNRYRLPIVAIERTDKALGKQQNIQRRTGPQRGEVKNKLGIGITDLTTEVKGRLNIPQEYSGGDGNKDIAGGL